MSRGTIEGRSLGSRNIDEMARGRVQRTAGKPNPPQFKLIDLFPNFRRINHVVRESLTAGGKAVLIAIFMCLFGLVYLETPLIFLFSSLVSIMVVAGIVSFLFRPQLRFQVLTPETAMYGQQEEIEVFLKNPRRRSTFDVNIDARKIPQHFQVLDNQLPLIEEVPGRSRIRTLVPFIATRRGVMRFPQLRASSSFPFNLFRFRQSFPVPGELIVLPRFFPLASFSLAESAFEFAGHRSAVVNRSAESDQFFGSREFVPGMSVRRWDYASWARLGKPVVREYQSEQSPMVSLFVDTFDDGVNRKSEKADDRLEATLSLAASLVVALRDLDFSIDQMMLGDKESHATRARDSILQLPNAMRLEIAALFRDLALAQREPDIELTHIVELDREILPDSAMVFVLLSHWDKRRAELLRQLNADRRPVQVILIVEHSEDLPAGLPSEIRVVSVAEIQAGRVEV